ncbi:MAG: hypothetical protein Kow0062_17300 [Acidobacteriota bacterium]
MRRLLLFALAIALAPAVTPAQDDGLPPAGEGNCTECHVDLTEGKVVHGAVEMESCDSCHEAAPPGHTYRLVDPIVDACVMCHDDPREVGGHVHGPVAEGKCTACHRPHVAEQEKLLVAEPPDLCWTCHGRALRTPEGRIVANIRKLVETSEVTHDAIDMVGCEGCHAPIHGTDRARLIAEGYPDGHYADGWQGRYELCFGCHDEELLGEDASVTGFRDGERNLHRVHVARDKSRACTFCHDPHGGGAHLMRRETPFGSWQMPIEVTFTETGGRCAAACHAPATWERLPASAEGDTGR